MKTIFYRKNENSLWGKSFDSEPTEYVHSSPFCLEYISLYYNNSSGDFPSVFSPANKMADEAIKQQVAIGPYSRSPVSIRIRFHGSALSSEFDYLMQYNVAWLNHLHYLYGLDKTILSQQ